MTRNKTILYAEDDVVTQSAYKKRLEQAGFTVETAEDGVDALKRLYQSKPGLLLLDLVLPRLTGEDVLRFLYSDAKLANIPVIVLSTNSNINVANEHLVARADKHLLKQSCTFELLLDAVETVLAKTEAKNSSVATAVSVSKGSANHTTQEIQELQNKMQVVCAWTGRIKVDDQWMNISEFLSKRLHLTVTHGVSPEAREKFLQEIKPIDPPPA